METFGELTIRLTTISIYHNIGGSPYACPESGIASSITVYLEGWQSGEKIKCAIYDASKNKVGETEERTTGGATGWYTFNFIGSPSLTAQNYYLVVWSDSELYARYGADSSDYTSQPLAYNSFPDPYAPTYEFSGYNYSIYCTYTPAAAPAGRSFGFIIG